MKRPHVVNIQNRVNGRKFGASFSTKEEAEIWIDEQIKNESWGKSAHKLRLSEDEIAPQGYISSEACILSEAIYDQKGNLLVEQIDGIEYSYEDEYVITREDLSQDPDFIRQRVIDNRKKEYLKIDDLLKEALVEKELGDPTKWNEYIELRNAIKTNNPF